MITEREKIVLQIGIVVACFLIGWSLDIWNNTDAYASIFIPPPVRVEPLDIIYPTNFNF